MRLKLGVNIVGLLLVAAAAAVLCLVALKRITIDTDIVRSLPTGDPVIADAIRIFEENPVKDRIAVDIAVADGDTTRLLAAADEVERRLNASGLFAEVGSQPMHQGLSDLNAAVVANLPLLFGAAQLERQVAPLLTREKIRAALENIRDALYQMDGIGQAAAMAADPLGLRNLVLARLADLNPAPGATLKGGRIVSADGRHVLLLATPKGSATDTATARRLARFFDDLTTELARQPDGRITVTPTGAYRAALDNETIIRSDVNRALLWATLGILLLLLAAFSRPLAGLLALLPALFGTVTAFFVFSLLHDSISIMVLGFGGAIISITVDHGIAYMLYVDGDEGRTAAAREIRSVGLLAVLTSVGAFGVLAFSGFAVFEQLGQFTAMGIGFSFLFVHAVLPRLIRTGSGEGAPARRLFSRVVDRFAGAGWPGLILALAAAGALAFFIRPHFDTDLGTMNSVRPATRAADKLMADVWGDIFTNVYLMTEAADPRALQAKDDRLIELLETERHAGAIHPVVTPATFFPGPQRSQAHLDAWRAFWSPDRVERVTAAIHRQGRALGFAPDAFDGFLHQLSAPTTAAATLPPSVYPLLGISRDTADGRWRQMTRITPTARFDHRRFYDRLSAVSAVFDPALFSQRMGALLFTTFMKMLAVIGVSLVLLLLLFFADLGLLFTALLPLAFAFVCTLGTLGLMGQPLDIPALMLSVVILGMGVDYTLFMVRGYQRYRRFDHPRFAVVRTAVVMAGGSTLMGFAVLLAADHGLLRSAGRISFFGIGYCLVGAFLILPPLLKRRFERPTTGGLDARYANMEPYPRLFARFKQRLDPLFGELETLAPESATPANILDVGCGYGVPACWLAERYPAATIHGIEPQAEPVRVAALALGERGRIVQGAAPDLPPLDVLLDMATLLDMNHFLQDWELEKTLTRIHDRLLPGGRLIMRSVLPPPAKPHWTWYLEGMKIRLNGARVCYRDPDRLTAMLEDCGFAVTTSRGSGDRGDMWWHVAKPG